MAAMRGRRGESGKRMFLPYGVPFTKALRKVFGNALKSPFKELELPPSKKKLNYEEQEIRKLVGRFGWRLLSISSASR
jgi:hypothetical protein